MFARRACCLLSLALSACASEPDASESNLLPGPSSSATSPIATLDQMPTREPTADAGNPAPPASSPATVPAPALTPPTLHTVSPALGGAAGMAGSPTPSGGGAGGEATGGMGGEPGGSAGNPGEAGSGAGGIGEGSAGTGGGPAGGTGGDGGSGGIHSEGAAGGSGEEPYNPCPPAGEPCRIVPFGDSITDGFNVQGGYRMELFHLALEAGQGIEFFGTGMNGPDTVDGVPFPRGHEGHSGFTIDDAPQAGRSGISPLVDTVLGFEPDIILLKIGTNDLDQNVDVANAPSRLGALLDDIFSKDDDVLVVVAQIVPSRSVELNARVAAYNAAIPNLVAERAASGQNVLVADMESAFLADPDYQNTLLADGLHPNERGYALLAATWYEVIGTFLR